MNDEEKKSDILKTQIYNLISTKASKIKPIRGRDLCIECNISSRDLKKIIVLLREDYPIVAKETDGGGYWIAESSDDIINFIQMIERRKNGYENTIKVMNEHLIFYGNVPFID